MKPIIRTQGLGKRYKIGTRARYGNLRESLTNSFNSAAAAAKHFVSRNAGHAPDAQDNHVWALREVDLDVMPGEVLGIIGRNGAGKSTLLKILSRITEPTTGRVDLYGRVGSLLEVGTGFHPELTGRENIHLNAAILGMRRVQIERKFDEIVAFAEVEKFIDTPVKHYSSGMYVRLAFAVAAHLEPEILLVDEVLAVGDLAFQKKCLGKMGEVARTGKTVILVSHNTASIESLCTTAAVFDSGLLRLVADPATAIAEYTKSIFAANTDRAELWNHPGRKPGAVPVMKEIALHSGGAKTSIFRMGESISFVVQFEAERPIRPCLGLTVKTERGFRIFHLSDRFCNELSDCQSLLSGSVECEMPSLHLMPGRYVVDLWLEDFSVQADLDMISDAITFDVISSDMLGTGRLPPTTEGPVLCRAHWKLGVQPGAQDCCEPLDFALKPSDD